VTETQAFCVLVGATAVWGGLAWAAARRRGAWAAIAVGLGFLGIGAAGLFRFRPDLLGRLIAGTDLARLYPAVATVPGVGLLVALGLLTTAKNRRAVLALAAIVCGFGLWNASFLLRDPAAALGNGGHWTQDCYMQSTPWSCAPAAACSLLRRVGVDTTEAEMARLMGSHPRYGTADIRIQHGLERRLRGTTLAFRLECLDYDGLVEAHAPGIASVSLSPLLNHAVAILEADPSGVTVLDPLRGTRRESRAELERSWRGVVIFVRPKSGRR